MPIKLEDVFGVSTKPVLSYVKREAVDTRFTEALKSDKQLVVYGSSKQGKTSLVSKYLPYDKNIVVSVSPKTQIADIYSSILRQLNVNIKAKTAETSGRDLEATIEAKAKTALLPLFLSGEATAGGGVKTKTTNETDYEEIDFNLELPQDIAELVRRIGSKKSIVLENFHYLDDDRQRQLAFDLRTFQELGIRFVILGVWREKNRLIQFNGDLLDRVVEIPVEPWTIEDFLRVAATGSTEMNIEIAEYIVEKCCDSSFSSIGVFQELLKETCFNSDVTKRESFLQRVEDETHFGTAVSRKADEYSSRHQRALEAIASGNVSGGGREGVLPLFLPYYLVKVILQEGYDGLAKGMHRNVIQEKIQIMHHRPADVRASDMSNLLHNLAALQSKKTISPPIVDYDMSTKMLQVVDSTFYFFLKNADLKQISADIFNPTV